MEYALLLVSIIVIRLFLQPTVDNVVAFVIGYSIGGIIYKIFKQS
jgi:hypothetical protein